MRMIDEDEVGLKEKPEDTRYIKKIEINPEASGVWAKDLIPILPLLGLRTRESAGASRLKAPSGGVKYPGLVAPTTGSLILVPPRHKEEAFKVFEYKLVERILLPFSNVTQGGGRGHILSCPPPLCTKESSCKVSDQLDTRLNIITA